MGEFETTIRFGASAADYISERTWSSDQKIAPDADGIILTMTATSPIEVVAWVLGFGDTAGHIARLAAS